MRLFGVVNGSISKRDMGVWLFPPFTLGSDSSPPGHTVRGMVYTQRANGMVYTQRMRGQVYKQQASGTVIRGTAMTVIKGDVTEDSAATILLYVKRRFANVERAVKQADLSSITYSVFDAAGAAVSGHSAVSVTIATSIFDTPRTAATDPAWSSGGAGYNFAHDLAKTAFPSGDTQYTYEVKFVYTDGAESIEIAKLNCQGVLTS